MLQHGINSDATTWLVDDPSQSLGFMLADRSFDVWMANNRGSWFSMEHESLDPKQKEFWAFSLDQMAKFDLPANLALISKITGFSKIEFIGHSLGNTQMFAALSDPTIRPLVAPYIDRFTALAPAIYFRQNKIRYPNSIFYLTNLVNNVGWLLNVHYFFSEECKWDQEAIDADSKRCSENPKKCYYEVEFLDHEPEVDNWARYGVWKAQYHWSGSRRTFIHFGQIIRNQIWRPNYFKNTISERGGTKRCTESQFHPAMTSV